MINSFSQYLVEEERVVYFTFGRMNPPTIGHGKLLDRTAAKAGRNQYRVYLSQTTDSKKNPLSYSDKVKHVRKMFPKHARSVMINKKVKSAIDALVALYDEGFRKVVMVVGDDRVSEFDIVLNKYNGKQARHGFYNFKSIDVVSAGARNPKAEGVEGMSSSKQRDNASKDDFTTFTKGLPKTMSNNDARRLFNDVRKGMGLKEAKDFKRHIELSPVSDTREQFVRGQLFELGEQVIIKKTDEVGMITVLGSNYVIVETADRKTRQWLDAVEKIEEVNQPEWGTPESAKKAKNMTPGQKVEKTLTPAEKKKREEIAKAMERDNPNMDMSKKMAIATATAKRVTEGEKKGLWYNIHKKRKEGRPMRKPGSKGAPTKQDFKNASEAVDHMAKAKDTIAKDKAQASNMIAKEREKDKVKHDRILDRARRARMLQRNKGVKP